MTRARGFEIVSRMKASEDVILPKRSTVSSAGYDFYSPISVLIPAGEVRVIRTGVKAYMMPNEFLSMHVRSSIGVKRHLMFANTTGIIDSDYYNNPDNEGEILIPLYNYGEDSQFIEEGEKVAQGIFVKFEKADDDNTTMNRIGGLGSTGK
jgi:dUTP pyrophosphatase